MKYFLILNVLMFSLTLSPASASDYPPGYALTHECQRQGPFEVCVVNRALGLFPRLEVKYEGGLLSRASPINVWIKNTAGQVYFKKLQLSQFNPASILFNDPASSKCVAKPLGTAQGTSLLPLNGEYAWCTTKVRESATSETLVWETHPASKQERDFVASILASAPLEFQVAAFNEKGEWDSQSGFNYHFQF